MNAALSNKIADYIAHLGPEGATLRQLENEIGVNYYTARMYVNHLIEEGKLIQLPIPRDGSRVFASPAMGKSPMMRKSNDEYYHLSKVIAVPTAYKTFGSSPLVRASLSFTANVAKLYHRATGNNQGSFTSSAEITQARRELSEVIKVCETTISNCKTLLNDARMWDERVVTLAEDPASFMTTVEKARETALAAIDMVNKETIDSSGNPVVT